MQDLHVSLVRFFYTNFLSIVLVDVSSGTSALKRQFNDMLPDLFGSHLQVFKCEETFCIYGGNDKGICKIISVSFLNLDCVEEFVFPDQEKARVDALKSQKKWMVSF